MVNDKPDTPSEIDPSQDSMAKQEQPKNNFWIIILLLVGLSIVTIFALITANNASSEPPPPQDDSWEKVQAAGVLRVAISVDYPPFSYYNEEYQIDGFDPALIKEIGAKLGIAVEISDYAFDGLTSVLNIGQADVVIAALSVSPAREAIVDFSNIYYVGQDGILGRADSGIGPIINPKDTAGMRIGVQMASIYQDWAQEILVNTGIITQDNLFVYLKPEHAVSDLRSGHLDLVIMDLQPATAALAFGDLVLAGQGLNQQRFAIAVPQGANSLKAEINRALLTLQNEGKVSELAGIYLGLKPEDVIPPPTPEPTPETCVDAMELVVDLNYADEDLTNFTKVNPGEVFQKGWRIRNSGSCTWASAYFINYVRGNVPAAQMQGRPTAITGEVKPGQTYDMFVNLVAPETAGKYVGYWQMFNEDNKAFGQTISVAVKVRIIEPVEPTATATSDVLPTLEPTKPNPTAMITPSPSATELPPESTPTEKPGSDLLDTTWILVEFLANIEDEVLTEPIHNKEVNLIFTEDDNFRGNAGCNNYNGRFVTNGRKIVFEDFSITQAICNLPAGIEDQETQYLMLLESAEEYRINADGQLELIRYIINENNEREEKILLVFDDLRKEPR